MFCGIFLLYVAILISLLGHRPLWLDEIWQQLGTRNISFHGMVAYAREGAGGALLPHFVQWCVLKAFPYSPAISRIPALLFGVGSVVLSWFLARRLRVKSPQIVVLLFMALPILFRYTLEARPYSQGIFFCCWGLLLLFELDEQPTVWRGIALLLIAAAGLYSQPFVIFELMAVALLLAGTSPDRWKRTWYLVLPVAASLLLYLPWYLSANKHWSSGFTSAGPVTVFDGKLPLRVLREYTGGGYVVGLCFLFLITLGFQASNRKRQKYILAAGFAAGLILPLLAEQRLQYFYAARHLIFALPAGILLSAFAFESLPANRLFAARFSLLGLLTAAIATIAVKEAGPHEDWQSVANRLESLSAQGNCIVTARPDGMVYYSFFQPSLNASACTPTHQRRVVLVADPYTPVSLLAAKSHEMESEGYEEARNEDLNGFRMKYFLLRGHQAFADRE